MAFACIWWFVFLCKSGGCEPVYDKEGERALQLKMKGVFGSEFEKDF